MMTTQTGYAPAKDGRLYYEIAGEGRPLVLIHSLLFDSRLWDDMFPAFAARYKTIRYDTRGFGKSTGGDLSVSDVEDLLALLDHLEIERAYVVGLSVGAEVAFYLTLKHPERVAALVMAGGGVIGWEASEESEQREADFWRAAKAGERALALDIFAELWVDGPVSPAAPEVRRRAMEIMGDYDFAYFIQAGQAEAAKQREAAVEPADQEAAPAAGDQESEPAEPGMEEQLAGMRVPTLLVAGDRDQPSVITSVHATAAAIPGAEAAIIAGAAHIIPLEQPAEFTRVVLDFLERRLA